MLFSYKDVVYIRFHDILTILFFFSFFFVFVTSYLLAAEQSFIEGIPVKENSLKSKLSYIIYAVARLTGK